jgi:hypothetical protein
MHEGRPTVCGRYYFFPKAIGHLVKPCIAIRIVRFGVRHNCGHRGRIGAPIICYVTVPIHSAELWRVLSSRDCL